MADLQRRPASRPSRRDRESRAYRLAVTGGVSGALGVLGLLLAVVTDVGAGIPLLLLVVAAVCGFLFRRTVS